MTKLICVNDAIFLKYAQCKIKAFALCESSFSLCVPICA